jgi:hypothetical protein
MAMPFNKLRHSCPGGMPQHFERPHSIACLPDFRWRVCPQLRLTGQFPRGSRRTGHAFPSINWKNLLGAIFKKTKKRAAKVVAAALTSA